MTFRENLAVLRERWVLVLVTVALAMGAAAAVWALRPVRYTATLTLYVSAQTADPAQTGLLSQQRVKSYTELIRSLPLSEQVVADLRLPLTAEQVAAKIDATSPPDSVLIDLGVTDPDARQATAIVNGADLRICSLWVQSPLIWGVHVAGHCTARTIHDIEPVRFAVSRLGSGSHLMAYLLAARDGFRLGADQLVIVGDIAGKGSPAALLAAAVLGMFSAEAMYQNGAASPITRVNAGLFRRAIEARFLTAFYGILHPDGSLIYTNAGHNPPILVTRQGIKRLEAGGVVLGLFEAATFEQEELMLEQGDVLLAFSDGVTEAMNSESEEFTDDRLIACANAHLGETPQQVLDALLADVHTFCAGEPQSDDVTAVLVRYNGV